TSGKVRTSDPKFAAGESFIIRPGEGPTTIAIRKETHEAKKAFNHIEKEIDEIEKEIQMAKNTIERLMREIRHNQGVIEGFGRGGQPKGTKFKSIMKQPPPKK